MRLGHWENNNIICQIYKSIFTLYLDFSSQEKVCVSSAFLNNAGGLNKKVTENLILKIKG